MKHCKRKDQVVDLLTKDVTTMTSNKQKINKIGGNIKLEFNWCVVKL